MPAKKPENTHQENHVGVSQNHKGMKKEAEKRHFLNKMKEIFRHAPGADEVMDDVSQALGNASGALDNGTSRALDFADRNRASVIGGIYTAAQLANGNFNHPAYFAPALALNIAVAKGAGKVGSMVLSKFSALAEARKEAGKAEAIENLKEIAQRLKPKDEGSVQTQVDETAGFVPPSVRMDFF